MLNHVTLIGKVTDAGPKLTYGETGQPECRWTLAIEEPGAQGKMFTTYIPCSAWGKAADHRRAIRTRPAGLPPGRPADIPPYAGAGGAGEPTGGQHLVGVGADPCVSHGGIIYGEGCAMATEEGLPATERRVLGEKLSRDLDLAIRHWGEASGARWLKPAGEELAALKIIHTTDAVVKRHAARMATR